MKYHNKKIVSESNKIKVVYDKETILSAICLINDCVVSMNKIGSYCAIMHPNEIAENILKYEREHKIPQKISKARTILQSVFSNEIISDEMSELEILTKKIKYWAPAKVKKTHNESLHRTVK